MKNAIQGIVVAFIGGFLLFLVTDLLFPNLFPNVMPTRFLDGSPSFPSSPTNTPTSELPTATPESTATPISEPPTVTPLPIPTPTPETPTPTSEPSTATLSPTATPTQPEPYISLINANVISLRFYESGNEGQYLWERVYAYSFASEISRYINWELRLQYPAPGRRINFYITAIYYRDTGTYWDEIHRQTLNAYVEGSGTETYHGWGHGCENPVDCWEVGSYRVDLHAAGKKIASKQFEIIATPTQPEPYIPSLNARVTGLKFYESDMWFLPLEERVYAERFDSKTSRYINWELDLEHPSPGRRIDFSITEIYYRHNGISWEEFQRDTTDTDIKEHWKKSYLGSDLGFGEIETWNIGTYRVDLYIEGRKIATGRFEIY